MFEKVSPDALASIVLKLAQNMLEQQAEHETKAVRYVTTQTGRRGFDQSDRATILRAYEAGVNLRDIGCLIGITPSLCHSLVVQAQEEKARRSRQAEGIKRAKAIGMYRGRPEDKQRNDAILAMLRQGMSWNAIIEATGCSRSTLSRLNHRQLDQTTGF